MTGSNPDVDTPRDLARAIETAWADAGPRESRAGRPHPRGPRRPGLLRAGAVPLPRRPHANRRPTCRGAAGARPSGRHVAGRRGRRRPLRAADRARPRPVGWFGRGARCLAVDAGGAHEIAEDHAIENVRAVELRWPPDGSARDFDADVALIAHVGYDVEQIGPFLDALEAASRRLCVALLMERAPASAADPFWPPVHAEERIALPALSDAVELLTARGRNPSETRVPIEPRGSSRGRRSRGSSDASCGSHPMAPRNVGSWRRWTTWPSRPTTDGRSRAAAQATSAS